MRNITQEEMKELLAAPVFHEIGQTADELGVECYVVGGYVRDLFLQRPSKDIDCVVVGSGIRVAEALKARLGRGAHLSVFRNFGTAQLKINDTEVEFVGARRESYSHDSRKPAVEDGTLEDDLDRRDFTINALAVCLNKPRFGELIDRFDGLLDLEDGIIATPLDPDTTFSDDPLRMMRCVRFATQLRFQIEDETQRALGRNAERIKIISRERIADELNKIIMSPIPSIGFIEMQRCGLLHLILPELTALEGVEVRQGKGHKDNFYHTLEVLDNIACATNDAGMDDEKKLWLRWAALLHDIGKPRTKRWENAAGWTFHNHNYVGSKMVAPLFRRMKLPLDERLAYVEKLVGLHMRPIAIADDQVTDSAVRRLLFEAGEDIDHLMMLCEADITSKNQQRKRQFLENFRLVREKLADLQARDNYRTWTNPVTGEEIMQTLGLPPCRQIGILKQAVKDAIWDSLIPNEHEAARQFMLQKAAEMGLHPQGTPLRAVLFDFDGTLVDTEEQYTQFWAEIGRQYLPGQDSFAFDIKGGTLQSMYAKYLSHLPAEALQDIERRRVWMEAHMTFPLVPGAIEFLRDLKAHGVKTAVVTSSDQSKMQNAFRDVPELMDLMDAVLTAEDFERSKPDPDPYLRAAARLDVPIAQAVVFEDALNGLQAGMASGMMTVGLTTGNSRETVAPLSHHVIDNYLGLNCETLQDWLNEYAARKTGTGSKENQ